MDAYIIFCRRSYNTPIKAVQTNHHTALTPGTPPWCVIIEPTTSKKKHSVVK